MMEAPESRTERQTVALTPSELNDLRLVAALENIEPSVLIRETALSDIRRRAERIRASHLEAVPA